MLNKFLTVIAVILLMASPLRAQHYKVLSHMGRSVFTDLKTHFGKPVVYSDSLYESLQNSFVAVDFRFGINSFCRMPQDGILKGTKYGVGITKYRLNSDSLGNPAGVYFFFGSPFFVNNGNFQLGFELSSGISFNFNKFDLVTNPKNDLIGSLINVYFNMSFWSAIRLSERLDMLASVDFTHFSNGTTKMPNKGLNLYGGNLGLRYHFQFEEKKKTFRRKTVTDYVIPDFKPFNEFSLWAGIGGKTIYTPDFNGPVYLCSTVSAEYNRHYSLLGRFGAGLDIFFDYSMVTDFPNETNIPYSRFMFAGIHGNYEFLVGNFSLAIQFGGYLWKGMPAKGKFFIRTGLKYDVTGNIFANLSLKTLNGFKADYIEAGIGIRFFKGRS